MLEHLRSFAFDPDDAVENMESWVLVNMVQQLNQWRGIRLGPWGSDPRQDPVLPVHVPELLRVIDELMPR
jgi:hypothetical protein